MSDPVNTPPVGAAPMPEHLRELRGMVHHSATRWKRLIILEALGLAVAAPLAYLWLVFFLDNLFHLPVAGRLLASLGFLAGVGYLVASLIRRWRRLHFTEDQVALAMEHETPGGVQNRLINAIQIARDPSPLHAGFNQALVEENFRRLHEIQLHQAAQVRPALIRIALAGGVIVVGVLFFALQREHFKNAAARIMLPFADVDPLYQTVLSVEPGNVEGIGDITIHVAIKGKVPAELTVLRSGKAGQGSQSVPLRRDQRSVSYTFKAVDQSMTYAVRGGDYLTPYYRIDVPTPATLSLVKIVYKFPAYTKLPAKTTQSAGGDLEALLGTKADVVFVLDRPADEVVMHLQKMAPTTRPGGQNDAATKAIPLRRLSPTEFAGDVEFVDVLGYQLQTRQARHAPHLSGRYALRVRPDLEPSLELSGLNKQTEANADATLSVKIAATDDFGLERVGLFARKAVAASLAPQTDAAPTQGAGRGDGWQPVEVWEAGGALELRRDRSLSIAALGAVEGERYEVALRACDSDPLKRGTWTTGPGYTLLIGGEGVALQLLYEQILRSEAEIKSLIAAEQSCVEAAGAWMQKLAPASGLRWDDKANLDALAAAMRAQAGEQEKARQAAGRTAREMVVQAGNLRLSVALLADSEVVRAIRILENVATRDNPQEMRSALADARITQERTIRSLGEILEQYSRFRQDWELVNMIAFVKMAGERQAGLRDDSTRNAALPADASAAPRQAAAARRQAKVSELCGLAQTAFNGLATRVGDSEPIISTAFTAASSALGASALKNPMQEAAAHAAAGRWAQAAVQQDTAAKGLAAIFQQLRAAQIEAAKAALAALRDKAASDLEAQAALKNLKTGSGQGGIEFDETKLNIEEIVHMREAASGRHGAGAPGEAADNLYKVGDTAALANNPNAGKQQAFDGLTLAKTPGGVPPRFPNQTDREPNKVTPPIQEKFEDLVGPLLDEADQLADKYDTYNLAAAFSIDEKGDIGKGTGDLASTAAAAATGNQKQPPADYGGVSRTGRQGARAHGQVAGNEGVNRRGRDEVQESMDRTPDQAGSIKQKHSDDEQQGVATGIGGKKVDAEHTNFSTNDTGKWTDDMADRMGKPQDTVSLVERQAERLDPRVAEMMRDLGSSQEQLIQRIKAIKKELHNLYLPTDQLDEIMAQLNANLDSLRDRPAGDVFRLQVQTLDKLRSTVRVLGQAGAGFQPSLPREQTVRGKVLDEPARQTIPGYEEAVKHYYEMLSTGE